MKEEKFMLRTLNTASALWDGGVLRNFVWWQCKELHCSAESAVRWIWDPRRLEDFIWLYGTHCNICLKNLNSHSFMQSVACRVRIWLCTTVGPGLQTPVQLGGNSASDCIKEKNHLCCVEDLQVHRRPEFRTEAWSKFHGLLKMIIIKCREQIPCCILYCGYSSLILCCKGHSWI